MKYIISDTELANLYNAGYQAGYGDFGKQNYHVKFELNSILKDKKPVECIASGEVDDQLDFIEGQGLLVGDKEITDIIGRLEGKNIEIYIKEV